MRSGAVLVFVGVLAGREVSAQPRRRAAPVVRVQAAPERACVPGAQVACACPGGGSGAQACTPDGAGYGVCFCAPVRLANAPQERRSMTNSAVVDPGRTVRVRRWYGWRTIVQDLISSGLMMEGAVRGSDVEVYVGSALFAVAPAITHWVSDESPGKGFLSLALRLALPFAGYLIGYGATSGDSGAGRALAGGAGAWGGMIAVSIFDAATLTYHDVEEPAPRAAGLRFGGGFAALPGGAAAMVGGSF